MTVACPRFWVTRTLIFLKIQYKNLIVIRYNGSLPLLCFLVKSHNFSKMFLHKIPFMHLQSMSLRVSLRSFSLSLRYKWVFLCLTLKCPTQKCLTQKRLTQKRLTQKRLTQKRLMQKCLALKRFTLKIIFSSLLFKRKVDKKNQQMALE